MHKLDAEKHLKKGTIVFDDFKENFNNYMEEWNIDEEWKKEYRDMIETNIPIPDWGVVKKDGKTYYI